jgi:hypothetical protein
MSQNVPKPKLKQTVRRRRIVELRAKGWKIDKIAIELGVNEKTVDRDLQSEDVQKFVDELIRQQLLDITESELKTRLKYRGFLLSMLLPKKTEVKGELAQKIEVQMWEDAEDNNSLSDAEPKTDSVPQ